MFLTQRRKGAESQSYILKKVIINPVENIKFPQDFE